MTYTRTASDCTVDSLLLKTSMSSLRRLTIFLQRYHSAIHVCVRLSLIQYLVFHFKYRDVGILESPRIGIEIGTCNYTAMYLRSFNRTEGERQTVSSVGILSD